MKSFITCRRGGAGTNRFGPTMLKGVCMCVCGGGRGGGGFSNAITVM